MNRRLRTILLIVLAMLFWWSRPLWHDFVMVLYIHPTIIEAIVAWGLLHRFALSRWRWLIRPRTMSYTNSRTGERQTTQFRWLWWVSGTALVLLLLLGTLLGNWFSHATLASEIEYRPIASLPESGDALRLMPPEVARRYAFDSLQLSQFRLGRQALNLGQNGLNWTFPLVPDGVVLKFLRKNAGVVVVDATSQEKNGRVVSSELPIGEGMLIFDNLWWNVYKTRYLLATDKPYYIANENDITTVVPAIGYRHRFRYGIWYTTPYFAGVFVTGAAGTPRANRVEFIPANRIDEELILAGSRVFPETLARTYAESYAYHLGVLNYLFLHEDQTDVQDVPEQDNRQPFLMQTEAGLKWFISTEPYGRSRGILKIFLVDAHTGEVNRFDLSPEESLTGPVRALDYVRQSNPIVDWNRFEAVEPLPFVRDGDLYWKVAVIPEDGAGIAYQAFVRSRDNAVFEIEEDEAIRRFVSLGEKPAPETADQPRQAQEIGERDQVIQEIQRRLREIERLLEQL